MKRLLLLLLAAMLLLAGCTSGQTDPATDVTANAATLNGHVACPTSDGSVGY